MRSGSPTRRPTASPARSSAPTSSAASLLPSASGPARSGSTVAISPPPDTPYGGYKQSGIGREYGVEGPEDFLETKAMGLPV
uniref:aldehyde dehydrogenase family protein n=1 Tax=Janibacter limosus TaxID=53458 RepID=UPI0035E11F4B